MAEGSHWEWRGFGSVSVSFGERFGRLPYLYGPQIVEDVYLWASGLQTNIKIRLNSPEMLKFKRPLAVDGSLQCWMEAAADLYPFPLDKSAWLALSAALGEAKIRPGPYPQPAPSFERLHELVKQVGVRVIPVSKKRMVRTFTGPNGRVLVEKTAVFRPRTLAGIAFESEDLQSSNLNDARAKEDLEAAMAFLRMEDEALETADYLTMAARWSASGA